MLGVIFGVAHGCGMLHAVHCLVHVLVVKYVRCAIGD